MQFCKLLCTTGTKCQVKIPTSIQPLHSPLSCFVPMPGCKLYQTQTSRSWTCSYDDDKEELEWDEVFNGAPMPGRNGIQIHYHSQAAKDYIDSLATAQKRPQGSLTQSKAKRLKADPDAVSSSQAMQDSTSVSATSQQLFPHQQANGHTAGSDGSRQSSDAGIHVDDITTQLNSFSPGTEEIPPNKRQRTSSNAGGPKRRSGGSTNVLQSRFHQVRAHAQTFCIVCKAALQRAGP